MSRVFTSTYHDTPDQRLAKAGIALRRRVENGLSLWEVELPEAPGETALAEPGGPAEPPPLLADLLQAVLRNRDLVEVTTVRTRRSKGEDDVAVLENQWVVDEFTAAVEGEDPGVAVLAPPNRPPVPPAKASPLAHLEATIRAQYQEILAHDPGTRLGNEPEAVHKFRVAIRRLRTILRLAEPMLAPGSVDKLRAELRWLGQELGAVRDLDVFLAELRRQADSLGAADASAIERIVAAAESDRTRARERLTAALSSERYLTLLGKLETLVEAPTWNGEQASLRKLARKEFRKLERAVAELDESPGDEALHRARVRGKRARYAAELAEPKVGKRASRFVSRAKAFQDVVGEHQDAVVAEARLRELGAIDPQTALVAGVLVERQRARRAAARAQAPKAWKKVRRAGHKAWA